MQEENANQRVYVVRCWREGQSAWDGKRIWRFSVEEVLRERRRVGFSTLAELLAFLRGELERNANRNISP